MLTAISLFAGAGGCSLGFQNSGLYSLLGAYDNNKMAVNTYNLNFGDDKCELVDLAECDFKQLRLKLGLGRGELDLIIGGPPCQGFSTAGTRFWDDPRNQLIKNYAQALEEFQPKWFMMENVEGLLTTAGGKYIYEAIKKFSELGYSLVMEKVYAQEYGVPQRRKRVVIIGNRLGIHFSFPTPIYPISGRIFRNSLMTLRTAIEDLEQLELPAIDHTFKQETEMNRERYSNLAQGQTMKDLPPHLQHESFKKRSERRVQDGTPSEKRGGPPSGLKRLNYDEPCLTITGAATREFIHPIMNRTLTIRECARIQTFPDDFTFLGNESQKITLVGNAIPPKLAEVFASHIDELHHNAERNTIPNGLISYSLTKAEAMSPALSRTNHLLDPLQIRMFFQGELFSGNF